MGREKFFGLIFILLASVFITACSSNASNETADEKVSNEESMQKKEKNNKQEQLTIQEKNEVSMEGDYAEKIKSLKLPINEKEWYSAAYTEEDNSATAEFVKSDENVENYTELVTIHYYTGKNQLMSIQDFTQAIGNELGDMVTGEADFEILEITDDDAMYEYKISDDKKQPDQQEIGRVFRQGEEVYVVRYTVMNEKIEKKEEWMEKIAEVH